MATSAPRIKKSASIRFLEIFPGVLTWVTLLGAPILSYLHPVWISVYIILFDLYWFLKGANVAIHLTHSYRQLKTHKQINWREWIERLANREEFQQHLSALLMVEQNARLRKLYAEQLDCLHNLPIRDDDYHRLYHIVILTTVKESLEVLDGSIAATANADYDHTKIIFVLAAEERGGAEALARAHHLQEKFGSKFKKFIISIHPDGIEGEAKVKGANLTWAAEKSRQYFDEQKIEYQNVIVSAFDSDTTVSLDYFSHLTFDFLTTEKPLQSSYQPMPMFHNNIWDTPAIARVIAVSSSFWQLVEASRPDRLITFSSHAMSFQTLVDVGFWRADIIPDDSHIFWQCFLHFDGDYRSKPLFTTVSMDAVLGDSYFGTLVAQYKQKRRWAWGVTEISMVFPEFVKNKKIPLWKKIVWGERLIEGHYFWATASIMIALLGWLPLIFGGDRFGTTVLALNLPVMTKIIMSIATFFLIFSMYINIVLLPPRPKKYSKWKSFSMLWQWVFSPIVSSVFGSMPAIDAQTRLMFGRYMEFWVTPKFRKHELQDQEPIVSEVIKL